MNTDQIIKLVAGISGGIVLTLQGVNLAEVTTVSRETNEEIGLIRRVHDELDEALKRQAEMIEILKKQKP